MTRTDKRCEHLPVKVSSIYSNGCYTGTVGVSILNSRPFLSHAVEPLVFDCISQPNNISVVVSCVSNKPVTVDCYLDSILQSSCEYDIQHTEMAEQITYCYTTVGSYNAYCTLLLHGMIQCSNVLCKCLHCRWHVQCPVLPQSHSRTTQLHSHCPRPGWASEQERCSL